MLFWYIGPIGVSSIGGILGCVKWRAWFWHLLSLQGLKINKYISYILSAERHIRHRQLRTYINKSQLKFSANIEPIIRLLQIYGFIGCAWKKNYRGVLKKVKKKEANKQTKIKNREIKKKKKKGKKKEYSICMQRPLGYWDNNWKRSFFYVGKKIMPKPIYELGVPWGRPRCVTFPSVPQVK